MGCPGDTWKIDATDWCGWHLDVLQGVSPSPGHKICSLMSPQATGSKDEPCGFCWPFRDVRPWWKELGQMWFLRHKWGLWNSLNCPGAQNPWLHCKVLEVCVVHGGFCRCDGHFPLSSPILLHLKSSFFSWVRKVDAAVTRRELHFLGCHMTHALCGDAGEYLALSPALVTFSISDLDLYGGWQSKTNQILKHESLVWSKLKVTVWKINWDQIQVIGLDLMLL